MLVWNTGLIMEKDTPFLVENKNMSFSPSDILTLTYNP